MSRRRKTDKRRDRCQECKESWPGFLYVAVMLSGFVFYVFHAGRLDRDLQTAKLVQYGMIENINIIGGRQCKPVRDSVVVHFWPVCRNPNDPLILSRKEFIWISPQCRLSSNASCIIYELDGECDTWGHILCDTDWEHDISFNMVSFFQGINETSHMIFHKAYHNQSYSYAPEKGEKIVYLKADPRMYLTADGCQKEVGYPQTQWEYYFNKPQDCLDYLAA
jgi:hypothetical protein